MSGTSQNISIALNANNDIYMDNTGNLAMLYGIAAIEQDCKCAMQAQYGEMIYEQTSGLPNLFDVWLQQNLIAWEKAARATLLAVPGVVQLNSFTYLTANNTLSYTAVILTTYGQTMLKPIWQV